MHLAQCVHEIADPTALLRHRELTALQVQMQSVKRQISQGVDKRQQCASLLWQYPSRFAQQQFHLQTPPMGCGNKVLQLLLLHGLGQCAQFGICE